MFAQILYLTPPVGALGFAGWVLWQAIRYINASDRWMKAAVCTILAILAVMSLICGVVIYIMRPESLSWGLQWWKLYIFSIILAAIFVPLTIYWTKGRRDVSHLA